jgi:hypothetical protein
LPVERITLRGLHKIEREKPVIMRFDLNENVGYQMSLKKLLDINQWKKKLGQHAGSPALNPEWHQPRNPLHPFSITEGKTMNVSQSQKKASHSFADILIDVDKLSHVPIYLPAKPSPTW